MQFKGLFVGETCTGTGAVQTLAGAYELETGINTVPFADAYADGALIPIILLASNGVNRIEGQGVFNSAGTLTITPWVLWNGTTYETYDGAGFTLPAGTHRIWVGVGGHNVSGISPFSAVTPSGNSFPVPDNVVNTSNFQDFQNAERLYMAPSFYASPVLFNRLAVRIGTAGAAASTFEAGIYDVRNSVISDADCGWPGKVIAKATFDATITGTQFVSVPLQILPSGRYWTGTVSPTDSGVTLFRTENRSHSGAWGMFVFNPGAVAIRITDVTALPDDLSSEDTWATEALFRSHLVGLGYVAA